MIYLDTSVVLAALFDEQRRPPADLWRQPLVSSRLLAYELHTRIHARGLPTDLVEDVLARVGLVELTPEVLRRALAPFPAPVRTLDALHLATAAYLVEHGQRVSVATCDARMATAAAALGLDLFEG
jgi:predicted nucleic acid-binding protein